MNEQKSECKEGWMDERGLQAILENHVYLFFLIKRVAHFQSISKRSQKYKNVLSTIIRIMS